MDTPAFSLWKYRHDGPVERSPWQRRVGLALLGGAPLVYWLSGLGPPGIAFAVIGLIVLLAGQRRLRVGPRYLICGTQIVYYANIDRAMRNDDAGTLRLETGGRVVFTLHRERFQSNARKAPKIAAHQATRFAKVADLLTARLRTAAPDCRFDA